MKQITILLSILLISFSTILSGQVIISEDDSISPESSAILEARSNDKGFLPPRMTLEERTAIVNPAEGLMVFCLDCSTDNTPVISVFISGSWRNLIYCTPPDSPTQANHFPETGQITWNWHPVVGASGYKWNNIDDYFTAIDLDTDTFYLENNLTCNSLYNRYLWTYNNCGYSALATTLSQSTLSCWICGDTIHIDHLAGNVAPVNKAVDYGTVTNVPGETSKCWITSNLGADHQATNYNDNTEASAGWFWQFSLKQGYKHNGSARSPNTLWITEINTFADWILANDPCNIELGTGWRVPTTTEWENVDAAGSWTNWVQTWNSPLKLHAAGRLDAAVGNLQERGFKGSYWTSIQHGIVSWAQSFNFSGSSSGTSQYQKAYGFTIRCIKSE